MTTLFDLAQPAENGLRRGFTTGSCATAAVKAGLLKLLCNENVEQVQITLPDGERFIPIPVDRIVEEDEETVRVEVIKDGGDDPDQTHRARIFARVRRNNIGEIRFLRGEGVGKVTQAGLQIKIGEPAINPIPRQMMLLAVKEVWSEGEEEQMPGFDLEIGCENGEEIARRTFNPRLGIEGGISILGTTGIVEPKSMAAFKASIEIYIRVALGENPAQIVLAPGNLGQRFARTSLGLPLKQVVQMSNFVGFALDCVEQILGENDHVLPILWIVGHPGKLAKVLDQVWDTHSRQSSSAVRAVASIAREYGISEEQLSQVAQSTTVEGIAEIIEEPAFWIEVEKRISSVIASRLTRVQRVITRLFQMDGKALGGME